jgi:ferredoxin-NADP reductase/predicted pyridoxine 5'-phosphate oxidase superfamily flavin-nucleotide-binding protein
MGRAFAEIAFTPSVRAAQSLYGSRDANRQLELAADRQDELGEFEREFIEQLDGFYQATVSETGWPYVQFRGGPRGFLKVIDGRTIAFADFRGNVQYLSVGNIHADGRVALFLLDHAHRRRLKIWGTARIVHAADQPELLAKLVMPGYRARVERAIVVTVLAYDWNCPQHITPRYTEAEIRSLVAPMAAELTALRQRADGAGPSPALRELGAGALRLAVTGIRLLTAEVRAYELRSESGDPLPEIEAGAHLSVPVRTAAEGDTTRRYWIASDPDDPTRWEIAVLRAADGAGGAAFVHEHYAIGLVLGCRPPGNGFRLHADGRPAVLIAGGIGVAPLKAMAHALKREGRAFQLHYAARSAAQAPYLTELQRDFADHLRTYWSQRGAQARMDLAALFSRAPPDAVFYLCGPERLVAAARQQAAALGLPAERVRFEGLAPAAA